MMRIIQLTITMLCISNANAAMRQRYAGRSGLRSATRRPATDKTTVEAPKRRNLQASSDEDSSDEMCGKGKSGKSGKTGKTGNRKLQSGCIQDNGPFLDVTQSNSSVTNSGDEKDDDENTPSSEGEHTDDDDEVSPSNEENTTMATLGITDDLFDDDAEDRFVVLGLDNTISDPSPLGSPQNVTAGEPREISNNAEISNDVRF